jgi:asparagine synthetase B (glutamine-hydrolysing)
MSKAILVCYRNNGVSEKINDRIRNLSDRLEPDNISFRPPLIISDENLKIAVFNPNDSTYVQDTSVCFGNMIHPPSDWNKPGGKVPEGTYALYRSDKTKVEVRTDTVASRTIWYYFDDKVFLASSSQRAIVFFLGNYQFNKAVIPWMLSSGALGPDNSWDRRLKIVKGDSSVILDRKTWKLNLLEEKIDFRQKDGSVNYHKEKLSNVLKETVGGLDLDYSKWVLPLSGGYDSRGILYMLKNTSGLRSITWGEKKSQSERFNDASVAKNLAKAYNLDHHYYLTDISDEPAGKILHRFLINSEGRFDNFSAYIDGFKLWKDLYENGISGIIRGDEGFGWEYVNSDLDVRMKLGIPNLSDYANLDFITEYGIEKQNIPEWILREEGETMETWRDRLYHQYRLPYILASLNDIKLSYVEIINPLLTGKIIRVVRELPDELRTEKKLFKQIVNSSGPKIPYARFEATSHLDNIFSSHKIVFEIIHELCSEDAGKVLPRDFLDLLVHEIEKSETVNTSGLALVRKYVKHYMPVKMKRLLRNTVMKKEMDFTRLAFRTYIISKINTIMKEDAKNGLMDNY